MLVVMPVVALVLARLFNFLPTVEIALIALSISPIPPLLPKKEAKAGGEGAYALGLMVLLSVLAIVVVPLALEILERISGRPLSIAAGNVARIVLTTSLLPLASEWSSVRSRLNSLTRSRSWLGSWSRSCCRWRCPRPRAVCRLSASGHRSRDCCCELPGAALRRRDPALPSTQLHCRHTVSGLAATADGAAPAGLTNEQRVATARVETPEEECAKKRLDVSGGKRCSPAKNSDRQRRRQSAVPSSCPERTA